MSIERAPFRDYHEDDKKEKQDIVPVRLNDDERSLLELGKSILEQERDATAIKQLMTIGLTNVIHDQKTKTLLALVFKNKRNNKRHGIVTFDPLGNHL